MATKTLESYRNSAPTDLQTRFADWITEKVAPTVADEASFREGVRLATALRMPFQASEENKVARVNSVSSRAEEREAKAKEREEKAAARKAAAEERVAKAAEKAAAAKQKAEEAVAKAEARAQALRDKAEGKVAPKPRKAKAKKNADTAETAADAPVETEEVATEDGDDAPW